MAYRFLPRTGYSSRSELGCPLLVLSFVRTSSTRSVFLGLLGGHVEVAVGVLGDPLDRLAGVLGEDLVEDFAGLEDLLGLDLDVGDLAAHLAVRLVEHDLGVRQGEALALGAAGQEDGRPAGRQPDAIGRHRAAQESASCRRSPAWR